MDRRSAIWGTGSLDTSVLDGLHFTQMADAPDVANRLRVFRDDLLRSTDLQAICAPQFPRGNLGYSDSVSATGVRTISDCVACHRFSSPYPFKSQRRTLILKVPATCGSSGDSRSCCALVISGSGGGVI